MGPRLQVQQGSSAAIISGKVPVHLLKITVKALLQIGRGVNYVSGVRTTAPPATCTLTQSVVKGVG